jgi:hypothetical protein
MKPDDLALLQAETQARPLEYTMAHELDDADEDFNDEIVEGVLGRGSMAALYGDSNSGKTFLAIDIGAAVGRGVPWLGRNTEMGLVVYLATEAPRSVQRRLKAYQRHRGIKVPGFAIVRSPINLYEENADTAAVEALVSKIEAQYGRKVTLIIGDTLARISAGANENSGEDMGVVLRNCDRIVQGTGATFLWIHHTGKEQARGMRGWSGMRAAIDTEIEIVADDSTGIHSAEITKQRDLGGKGDRFGFRLEPVLLGTNPWGKSRSSCVVVSTDAPPKRQRAKRPSEIAGAIVEVLTQRGSGMKKSALVKHFENRHDGSAVYREIAKMVEDERLLETAGVVQLPAKQRGAN